MKFFSKFKLSRRGITIITGPDTYRFCDWRYFITGAEKYRYPSTPASFSSSPKLFGFDYPEILSQWIAFKYPREHIIVLLNINVQAKNIQFWAKVPQTDMKYFLQDTVILRCKDKSEVIRLVENIPPDFADAYGYSAGSLFTYNKEDVA
jgi:hypothetical protein